ncbi:MAG TPA: CvpA family protein [Steroidobacteraceae bacterium]|nr:CvpA family protein [Steroidobacteraceae bacterium]
MIVIDYLIIALIVFSAVVGLARGLLREVIALVTWVIALLVAWHFASALEPHLGGLLGGAVRPWAARAILLVGVLLLGAGIGAIVVHLVRLSIFSGMDRLLGFVFGLLRGIVILGVLVLFCQMLRLDGESWWHRSLLIPYGEHVAGAVRLLVGSVIAGHDLVAFSTWGRAG